MNRLVCLLAVACMMLALAPLCPAGKFTDQISPSADKAKKPDDVDEKDAKSKLPIIKQPVMFNTPEADALMSRINLVPKNSPWRWDISKLPVAKNSREMIRTTDPNGSLRACWEMAFVIVPPDQKKVDVRLLKYPRESDPGPYPVTLNMPVQGWPMYGGTLENAQRVGTGDRHAFVLDPYSGRLYEFYEARLTDAGWTAAQASVFDLSSNKLRPDGWTSADAAGLPILPGTVRYDEVERGVVDHALRVTFARTRAEHIYPARHHASPSNDPNLPRMGERIRLRADYDISRFPKHAQAILACMKKYGLIVCDNGGNWDICLTPDTRIQGMQSLKAVKGGDFEVVDVSSLILKDTGGR